MEKIVRKRVFYLGIGPKDEIMRDAARRFEGRYYRALQHSHGWSFPVSRLAGVREALKTRTDDRVTDTSATQTDDAPLRAVSDRATQTDDRPVYAYDIDPGLSRWVRERYLTK